MSASDLAPFVAAVFEGSAVAGLLQENNELKSREEKRFVVQITGTNGTPIHYEKSFKDAELHYDDDDWGDDDIVLRFNKRWTLESEECCPICLDTILDGPVNASQNQCCGKWICNKCTMQLIQRREFANKCPMCNSNLSDRSSMAVRFGLVLSSIGKIEIRFGGVSVQRFNIDDLTIHFQYDQCHDDNDQLEYITLKHIHPRPNVSGPITSVRGRYGPLPLGWRWDLAGRDMLLTDFIKIDADVNNGLTPFIIHELIFDEKDVSGIIDDM
ncbi:hypothetical protein FRACYDRAFT_238556 [Fragilariopsis cylindrus CCMP1102]|uniref:RING-type domain-containing protein n=1 Tax=Fragilariopsis cylindrus CCMP1102 TaxID=635003 RepID=A0A1E7FIX1_9STRA|nr:hypothetical protein FRACYDRAFT_238556 [Fragilariopsis cylindrus CCMP1102]|eukprot:OEU18122.1 hypothetical protein FRACYDRAFT_238556 [Fragilariopsis cylindrus CCMP1102]